MHDFDPEETQSDASAPLVDYDSVDDARGHTPATQRTDMSTMPETRSAARSVLERELAEQRPRAVDPAYAAERDRGYRGPMRQASAPRWVGEAAQRARHCAVSSCSTPTSCEEYGCKKPAREAHEFDAQRERDKARDFGREQTRALDPGQRLSPDYVYACDPDGTEYTIGGKVIPPRRPEESRSLASSPAPTVGSIVLYYPDRSLKGCDVPGPFPAIVTRVLADSGEEQLVNLQVFGSGLSSPIWNIVPRGGALVPGSWSPLSGVA
jgi:hypothetical protein